MDLLEDLQVENDFNVVNENIEIHRRRRFKSRTSVLFFEEMSDFEFLRTFRFSKEGVRHMTGLLGEIGNHNKSKRNITN